MNSKSLLCIIFSVILFFHLFFILVDGRREIQDFEMPAEFHVYLFQFKFDFLTIVIVYNNQFILADFN
jgi:hypothetical protein